MQKENVDVDGEKGAQIWITVRYIVTKKMTPDYEYGVQTSSTLKSFFNFLC